MSHSDAPVFLHDFVYVDRRADRVRQLILGDHGAWLSPLASDAVADGDAIRVRLGPLADHCVFGKQALIETGAPFERGDVTVIPLTWTATGLKEAFPVLEADLEVAALGDERTQLSLLGRYEPPLGPLGRRLDQLLLHRVAEATARAFLHHVATTLEAMAASPTTAVG